MNSLRARLTLLLAAAAALPLAVVLASVLQLRRIADEEALHQAHLLASLTASGLGELFGAAGQLVENYVASDEVLADPPECPGSMRRIVERSPYLLNFGVVLPDGRIVCSVLPVPAGVSFEGYEILAEAMANDGPVVSDYAIGPVVRAPVIFVGQAARAADGTPTAIVFTSVDLAKLLEVARVDRLPPGATLRIVDRNGTILARHPDNAMWQGRAMGTGEDRIILSADSGSANFTNLDGVARRNGFVAIHPGGNARIAISVGLDGGAAVRPIERLLGASAVAGLLALLGTIGLVTLGGKRLLLDDVRRLQRAARALGRGDFEATAGVSPSHGELAELDASLRDVGAELAARERQLTNLLDEARLQRDELRALYDTMPVGVVGLTPDLRVRHWSAGAERLFGWSAVETLGQPPLLVPPEEFPFVQRIIDEVRASGQAVTYHGVRLAKDGRRIPANIAVAPAMALDGSSIGTVAVLVDVSDLRAAEERTQRAEAALRAVVEAAPLAIMAVDAERRATLWSGGAERLFRIAAGDVVGNIVPMPKFAPPEIMAAWEAFIGRALAGETFGGVETVYDLPGMDRIVTDTSGAPVRDATGSVVGAVFTVADITARKRDEARLAEALDEARASRDHLLAIYEAVPVGVVTTMHDGTVVEWSPGMERLFGWARAEVLGKPAPWVPPDKLDEFMTAVRGVLRDGTVASYDAVRRRKDGSEIAVAIRAAAVRDSTGRPIAVVGVVMDITERRALEEREREAQARLRAIVAAVPVGIMAVDAERRVTLWSRGGEQMFNLPEAWILGRRMPEEGGNTDPATLASWRALHDRVLSGEVVAEVEHEYNHPDYVALATSTSGVPLRDADGRVTGAVYAIADITGRKRAEKQVADALAEARAGRDRLAALVAASPVAIVQLDAQHRVAVWSPAAERTFGWTASEVLGGPPPFTHPDDVAQIRQTITDLRQVGAMRSEAIRHRKDGSVVWISSGLSVLHAPDGTYDGLVAVLQDITREKEAQLQVSETVEELRRLSAHLNQVREGEQERLAREVHDEFGQLLTGLKLDLTLLDRQLPDVPGNEAARQRIPQMRDLVDELVAAGRRIVAELRPPALDRLGLGAAVEALAGETSRRGLAVSATLEADTAGLHPDTATALYRIAQEGITNVLKHSGATEAHVRLTREGERLRLVVEDNGRGLPDGRRPGGVGLISMRERASLVGGTLSIGLRPEGGTTIVADVPWREGNGA